MSTKNFAFSHKDLIDFDPATISPEFVEGIWREIDRIQWPPRKSQAWTSKAYFLKACRHFRDKFGIDGYIQLSRISPSIIDRPNFQAGPPPSRELIEKVEKLLPPQPWKIGIHKPIIERLGCTSQDYFGAVKSLIDDGVVYQQRDGVIYDLDGNVVGFDEERVDPMTMRLKE